MSNPFNILCIKRSDLKIYYNLMHVHYAPDSPELEMLDLSHGSRRITKTHHLAENIPVLKIVFFSFLSNIYYRTSYRC